MLGFVSVVRYGNSDLRIRDPMTRPRFGFTRALLVGVALLLGAVSMAHAWRSEGHQVIALVAQSQLSLKANTLGCVHARRVERLVGFPDKSYLLEAFCAASLGDAHVDRPAPSSGFGFEPVGGVERVVRSTGRF